MKSCDSGVVGVDSSIDLVWAQETETDYDHARHCVGFVSNYAVARVEPGILHVEGGLVVQVGQEQP